MPRRPAISKTAIARRSSSACGDADAGARCATFMLDLLGAQANTKSRNTPRGYVVASFALTPWTGSASGQGAIEAGRGRAAKGRE
ncbi:hypothetical protein JCM13591A_37470 [Microbacterium xylanilyticum]